MRTVLDDVMRERISFLYEQIRPENKAQVNATFQLQLEILQSADIEKLGSVHSVRNACLKRRMMLKKLTGSLRAIEPIFLLSLNPTDFIYSMIDLLAIYIIPKRIRQSPNSV